MKFISGQQVVWIYQPRIKTRQIYLVDAEVVQPGRLRTLIRITTLHGRTALRWVKPTNLRYKSADEPGHQYPKPN
jgi:hypothetical protein